MCAIIAIFVLYHCLVKLAAHQNQRCVDHGSVRAKTFVFWPVLCVYCMCGSVCLGEGQMFSLVES